jgi:hypothetical protein
MPSKTDAKALITGINCREGAETEDTSVGTGVWEDGDRPTEMKGKGTATAQRQPVDKSLTWKQEGS